MQDLTTIYAFMRPFSNHTEQETILIHDLSQTQYVRCIDYAQGSAV